VRDATEVETSLARNLDGDELLAALEAAEEAWTAAGLTAEARAVHSILLRRRGAPTEPPNR